MREFSKTSGGYLPPNEVPRYMRNGWLHLQDALAFAENLRMGTPVTAEEQQAVRAAVEKLEARQIGKTQAVTFTDVRRVLEVILPSTDNKNAPVWSRLETLDVLAHSH